MGIVAGWLLVYAGAIEAQTVSGRVVDEAGKPLSGATVVIVNTNVGAVTGKDGSFQLDAGTDQRICVSYVGKETLVLPVEDCLKNKDGRVCLKEETARISSELVVTDVPQKVTESGETFTVVEQMPAYPGGMGECLKFLAAFPEPAFQHDSGNRFFSVAALPDHVPEHNMLLSRIFA